MAQLASALGAIFSDIKLAHTLFALPFALLAAHVAFLATHPGTYNWRVVLLILGCMVCARSAAMGFNRWLDRDIDARNPRTQSRAIPAQAVAPTGMLLFTGVASVLFVVLAAAINPLTMMLALPALAIVLGYSYAKRFTSLAHLWLGFALAVAPMGAWIAVTGRFEPEPFWLVLAVTTWVGGFDILYSCQDVEFDRSERLHSIPGRVGIPRALMLSSLLHAITVAALVLFGLSTSLSWLYFGTIALIAGILAWEHRLVRPTDLSRINLAFFTLNGAISVLLYAGVLLDTLVLHSIPPCHGPGLA